MFLQVMERRQAAAEEAEEQGSEGSGRDTSLSHRNSSAPPATSMSVQELQDLRLESLIACQRPVLYKTRTKPVKPAGQVACFVSPASWALLANVGSQVPTHSMQDKMIPPIITAEAPPT